MDPPGCERGILLFICSKISCCFACSPARNACRVRLSELALPLAMLWFSFSVGELTPLPCCTVRQAGAPLKEGFCKMFSWLVRVMPNTAFMRAGRGSKGRWRHSSAQHPLPPSNQASNYQAVLATRVTRKNGKMARRAGAGPRTAAATRRQDKHSYLLCFAGLFWKRARSHLQPASRAWSVQLGRAHRMLPPALMPHHRHPLLTSAAAPGPVAAQWARSAPARPDRRRGRRPCGRGSCPRPAPAHSLPCRRTARTVAARCGSRGGGPCMCSQGVQGEGNVMECRARLGRAVP